jgi:hypothetical protein
MSILTCFRKHSLLSYSLNNTVVTYLVVISFDVSYISSRVELSATAYAWFSFKCFTNVTSYRSTTGTQHECAACMTVPCCARCSLWHQDRCIGTHCRAWSYVDIFVFLRCSVWDSLQNFVYTFQLHSVHEVINDIFRHIINRFCLLHYETSA